MRDFQSIYDIVELEIQQCLTQFFIRDKILYQPIIIAFNKTINPPEIKLSSLYTKIPKISDNNEIIRPFLDKRYGNSIKIQIEGEKYEINAIDSYYIKFLKFHVMCDELFKLDKPSNIEETNKYYGTQIFALGSDISGIMDIIFDRRARNQLGEVGCECLVFEECDEPIIGKFWKGENDELLIRTNNIEIKDYYLNINEKTFEISGRTGEINDYKTVRIVVVDPLSCFLIGCIILSMLKSKSIDAYLKVRIINLIDLIRCIVDDPNMFHNVRNIDMLYLEVQDIINSLKD